MGKKERIRKLKKFDGSESPSNSKQAFGNDVNIRKSKTSQPKRYDTNIPEVSEELKNKLSTNCDLHNETSETTPQSMSENISQGHFSTTPNNVCTTKKSNLNNSVPDVTSQILNQGHGSNPPLGHNIKPAQQNVVIHNMDDPTDFANKVPLEPQHNDVMNHGPSLNVEANEFVPRHNQDPSDSSDHTKNVQLPSDPPGMQNEHQLQHSDPNHGNSRERKDKQPYDYYDRSDDRPHQDYSRNRGKRDRSGTSQSKNVGPKRDSNVQNSKQPDKLRDSWEDYDQESETTDTKDVQKVHHDLESENDSHWSYKKYPKNSRKLKKEEPSPISSEKNDSRGYQRGGKSHHRGEKQFHSANKFKSQGEDCDAEINTRNIGSAEKNKVNKQKQQQHIRKCVDPRLERERKSLDTSRESQQPDDNSFSLNSSRKSTDSSRLDTSNKDIYNRSYEKADKEYMQFEEEYKKNKKNDPVKVKEIGKDLFEMPAEYALGHCVAEDMRMGSGIAVNFKRDFKCVEELLNQRQKQGGLAYLEVGKRFIYYLVTKRESTGKPTYQTFWSSLKKMRDHIIENKVKKLAIPRIGCGLDRLEWSKVGFMLEFLFRDVDVEITVCNFQQMEDSSPQKDYLSNKIVNDIKPLVEIEEQTIILYTATEDGHISEEMKTLAKKFNILPEFKKSPKQLGKPIKHVIGNYMLYGCVVRKTEKSLFDFCAFGRCLYEINKNNRKDLFEYVALQAVYDAEDDYLLNEKIITLLRFYLKQVNIHICPADKDNEDKKQWRSQ